MERFCKRSMDARYRWRVAGSSHGDGRTRVLRSKMLSGVTCGCNGLAFGKCSKGISAVSGIAGKLNEFCFTDLIVKNSASNPPATFTFMGGALGMSSEAL